MSIIMISKRHIKQVIFVTFGTVYFISFWLLTVGYFTPYWLLLNVTSGSFDADWNRDHLYEPMPWTINSTCDRIGLVKPTHNCDSEIFDWLEDKNVHQIRHILRIAFILMTTAVVVVYTNAMMLTMSILFDWLKYSLYASMLSLSFGVCYPIAAILILVATIYVEAYYTSDTGFSTMLCTIAGCLMLLVYFELIVYDKVHANQSLSNRKKRKLKHRATSGELKGAKKTTPFALLAKLRKGNTIEPILN